MADQSDVEAVLVGLVGGAVYPGGVGSPSVLGRVVRVYRGWPTVAALDRDLALGHVNITVFPDVAGQVVTTRWPDSYEVPVVRVPGVEVTEAGETVSDGGEVSPGEVVGLLVDNVAVVHRTGEGDDAEGVAAAVGVMLREFRSVVVSGATLVVPGAGSVLARVVADQTALRQTRRQRQNFRVTCWCPDPLTRDDAAGAIDAVLSVRSFIGLPDGLSGRLRFVSSSVFDQTQDAALYRRDLVYSVEYATTVSQVMPSMLFGDAVVGAEGSDVVQSLLG